MQTRLTQEHVYQALRVLEVRYNATFRKKTNATKNQIELGLICKLSVIEFCGWIEVIIDEILLHYISQNIVDVQISEAARAKVKKVHGCDPEGNLKPLLRELIGYRGYAKYYGKYSTELDLICNSINRVGGMININGRQERLRNIAAHTNYDQSLPTQQHFPTPSMVLYEFRVVHALLKKLRKHILHY